MTSQLLRIYLQDHLAGATGGASLAVRLARNNQGTSYAAELTQLSREVADDLGTLQQLMAALHVSPNPAKNAAASVAERVGRLKLNGRLTGYSPLSRLVEIEALKAGVQGKAALWRSLQYVADDYPALDTQQFSTLQERAQSQLDRLLSLHRRAAVDALAAAG